MYKKSPIKYRTFILTNQKLKLMKTLLKSTKSNHPFRGAKILPFFTYLYQLIKFNTMFIKVLSFDLKS